MRCVPVLLLLAHLVLINSALAQGAKAPRLDINGDPLPAGAIARLGALRFLPRGHVRAAALSPDGTTVVTATEGARETAIIEFLDTSTGKSVRELDMPGVDLDRMQMQFTPDGKGLVLSSWSSIKLVDGRTGKIARTIQIGSASEPVFTITADGKWVAAQPHKFVKHAPVIVWDTKTGKELASLPGRGASCKGLAFSPDGKRLLLWSIVPTLGTDGSMSFPSKSNVALVCIDVSTRKIVAETTVAGTQFVALCPDGETVAIEAADHRSILVRHLPTGTRRCVIPVRPSRFAFTHDGKTLITVDEDGQGALWGTIKGDKVRDLEGTVANKDFDILGASKDARTIAVLDGGWRSAARVIVWNGATGKRIGRPPGHDGAITCLVYAPGGKVLASGSIDRTVRLWSPATGKHLRVLTVHKGAITAVAISPDGKLVASSSEAGVTRVSNLADGKLVADFAGPEQGATALAFSQDSKVLFMGGQSSEVLARAVASGKAIVRLKTGEDGAVMAFGNGGAFALTANGEIRDEKTPERLLVWGPPRKQPIAALPIQDQAGGSVRCDAAIFSPDGRMIASSQVSVYYAIRRFYGAAQLRLWERASGGLIRTLSPTITSLLAFSPNGRLLASGGAGLSGQSRVGYGTGIDVWDTLTGEKVGALPVTPQCLAFSPDGAHLATGGRDHAVLIWEAPKPQPRKKAKAPSAAERDAWWVALGRDASNAYKAIGQMIDAPVYTVALLKERVRPVQASDPATVARLIVRLDSETFAEREKAQQALEKMGEGAEHLLKAFPGTASLELRLRIDRLLKKCKETSTLGMQHHRAVLTLEWIGTPAARALLRHLADGAPRARLTTEARAALDRLQH